MTTEHASKSTQRKGVTRVAQRKDIKEGERENKTNVMAISYVALLPLGIRDSWRSQASVAGSSSLQLTVF